MKASEIIQANSQRLGIDPNEVLQAIQQEVESQNSILMQKNDSLFVLTKIQPDVAGVAMFTADGTMTLPRSISEAIAEMKKEGISTIYGDNENTDLLNGLKQAGVQIEESDLPDYAWKATI
jgi:hypothetical protein